jgi:hypothetical protein
MKDYRSHLETLRKQAAESALISALATDPQKRDLFAKHAAHLNTLAAEVERAMAASNQEASASTGLPALLVQPNWSSAAEGCSGSWPWSSAAIGPDDTAGSLSFDTSPPVPSGKRAGIDPGRFRLLKRCQADAIAASSWAQSQRLHQ